MRFHLQSTPRMHRGSRRNPFQTRCVVSPARVLLVRIVAHAETTFRLGTCFSSIASWITRKRLSDWLRGLSCRAFLDRIVAHAEILRLFARSHPQRFPRLHRASRTNVFQSGYAAPPADFVLQSFPRLHRGSHRNIVQIGYVVSPVKISSTASCLTQKRH